MYGYGGHADDSLGNPHVPMAKIKLEGVGHFLGVAVSLHSLQKLASRYPPPSTVIDRDYDNIGHLRKAFPDGLPEDYVAFCKQYGSGGFHGNALGDLRILNCFSSKFPVAIKRWTAALTEYLEMESLEESWGPGSDPTKCLYPEPGGLLVWGSAEDSHLCWIAEGHPNHWSTTVLTDGYLRECYDMSFVDFLLNLFSGYLEDSQRWSNFGPSEWADVRFKSFGGHEHFWDR
jgi:hypothetical protein